MKRCANNISVSHDHARACRGSPCHFPEETLEGYRQAIKDGADYIEMDIVSTLATC